ncbi:pregnancy-specific beta-1-glycoprotein 5-like [Garra rufa]|uniref:pregnancy-specific beta-1-glycoprotein 5-like n=1 Tax=Garra rufa TaxID=137080 RepID=UPI003CCEB9AB
MFCLFSLISLLMIPAICSQEWKVQYTKMKKCVLKDSTIILSGTYEHPAGLTVTERFWIVNPTQGKTINLLDLPDYKGRVQFFQNKDGIFFLKLSNVTHEDEGMYCLRILTNEDKQRYLGFPGIELNVTELSVEIPERIIEGQTSVLFCNTTCDLSGKTDFTWYKNGKRLSESIGSNQLLLQSVSSDDSGNYSCAVSDQKHLPSPVITLSVRYPPKSVSVSISPSAEIVEGDSLICSSDSNPPALNFSWFKENQSSAVGSGQSFSISSFNSSHSGCYYCRAQNEYGSERSASVSVTVKVFLSVVCTTEERSSSLIRVTVGITAAVVLTSVILTVFIGLLIRRKRATPSEEQNRGSRHKTLESPGDTYMTLDPKSRCSEYDTLDNMKRSCENTDDPEAEDSTYYNIDK